MSQGTNQIIKDGHAVMITSAQDILAMLNIDPNSAKKTRGR